MVGGRSAGLTDHTAEETLVQDKCCEMKGELVTFQNKPDRRKKQQEKRNLTIVFVGGIL